MDKKPTTKNDLGVDCIDRAELLKAMDTWDKFGYSARYGLERLDKDDKGYVPYVHYDDMVICVKGMPSVIPQEPKIGRWIDKTHTSGCGITFIKFECSNCHKKIFDDMNVFAFNYCPLCGAKMESENAESEDK